MDMDYSILDGVDVDGDGQPDYNTSVEDLTPDLWAEIKAAAWDNYMFAGKSLLPGGGGRFHMRVCDNMINEGMSQDEAVAEAIYHGKATYGPKLMKAWNTGEAPVGFDIIKDFYKK